MGIDAHAVRFLLDARARGVPFDTTAMIGRQSLHVEPAPLQQTLQAGGITVTADAAARLLTEADGFCEPLLRLLGAQQVESIDLSPYQHATILHDMNTPLPEQHARRFSLVIDGGSLEHVFNFPQAIANCMRSLRPGGYYMAVTPANNFMGHGFYQFSPELYYRVFSPENGFAVERMVIYEDHWPTEWYQVTDPEAVKRRVILLNRYPTYLLILARKLADVAVFATTPQQSDYTAWWQEAGNDPSRPSVRRAAAAGNGPSIGSLIRSLITPLANLAPAGLKHRYHHWRAGGDRFDPEVFKKVER